MYIHSTSTVTVACVIEGGGYDVIYNQIFCKGVKSYAHSSNFALCECHPPYIQPQENSISINVRNKLITSDMTFNTFSFFRWTFRRESKWLWRLIHLPSLLTKLRFMSSEANHGKSLAHTNSRVSENDCIFIISNAIHSKQMKDKQTSSFSDFTKIH